MLGDVAPFFLTINYNHEPNQPWYKKTLMGINKLYEIMNELKTGGLETDKRLTPYRYTRWLDDLQFTSYSPIFQSYQDDLRVKRFCLEQGMNSGPLDQVASA